MGFRYNQQQQQRLTHLRCNVIEDKKKSNCENRFIQRAYVKRSRRRLSAEDRKFLQSVGLRVRKN